MSRKFQIKRGQSANLPTLAEGELGFTLDTGKLYVGNTNGNVEMARADAVPTKTSQLTNDSGFKTTDNNTTYALSKSGSTITLTGSDGKTTSVTDSNTTYTHPTGSGYKHIPSGGASGQFLRWSADGTAEWSDGDSTTYVHPDTHPASMITGLATVATSGKYSDLSGTPSAAGSSLGLVKSGGDVSISNGVITVNDDSHNHTIANVDGLQTALDGKLGTSGNAASATKATQDGNGNNIVNTYATKADVIPIVTATSTDGAAYTATVSGLTSLEAGAMITIIPSMTATSTTPTLKINSLTAVQIRRKLSSGTLTRPALLNANVVSSGVPLHLMYDGSYWVATQFTKPSAGDLSGTIPVGQGGTGATTADAALTNLGAAKEWAVVENTGTTITVTVADKTEYYYPNATRVTINAPSGVTKYECYITVGGANPTITFPTSMKMVGIDTRSALSRISNTEISIKDGKYVIGCVGS